MTDARVIHFEITGRDGPALQAWYANLLGWQFDTNNPGGYGMSSPDRTGVVVGIGATPDGSAGQVTGYVTVDDIDATVARAVASGGRLIMPRFEPGGGAILALVADPEGHVLGLTQV